MPLGLLLVTSNVRGFTKRAVVNACVLVMYCVANIVGPQFFSVDEAPRYNRGITASLAGFGLGIFWLKCLRVYLQWQNRVQSREDESSVPPRDPSDGGSDRLGDPWLSVCFVICFPPILVLFCTIHLVTYSREGFCPSSLGRKSWISVKSPGFGRVRLVQVAWCFGLLIF
jgi:hypothetical protein